MLNHKDDDSQNLEQLKLLNLKSQKSQQKQHHLPASLLKKESSYQPEEMKNDSQIVVQEKKDKQEEIKAPLNLNLKKNREIFTLNEIGTFTFFASIMIYIVSSQLMIEESYQLNSYMKYNFSKNFTTGNKLLKSDINQYLQSSILREFYSTEKYYDYDLKSEMRFVSYLRLKQTRIELANQTIGNSTINIWKNPLTYVKDDYGVENIFKYSNYDDGFVQFFNPFNTTSKEAKDRLAEISNLQYFDQQTKTIYIDCVLYNNNYDMIALIQVDFDSSPAGSSLVSIKTESYRIQPYTSTRDKVRMVFEIIFLVLYVFYVIDEFFKISRQISKVQQEYKEKQDYKEELREQTKNHQSQIVQQKNKNQPFTMENALETIQKFSRVINILKGLGNHVQNIWSFLDVANLTFIGLAINYWLKFALNDDLTNILKNMPPSTDLTAKSVYDLKEVNEKALFLADLISDFRICACLSVFIAAFKTTKYWISLSQRLSDYLAIMMRMLDFMLFYLILLTSIIFAFAYMGIFIYGAHISEYSTLYRAIVQTIILMISGSSVSQEMIDFNLIGTFFYFLVFYFLTISILVNMFWVFVKNEYLLFEKEKEQILKLIQDAAGKSSSEVDTHIYYYFKTQLYDIFIRVRYFFNQQQYKQYQQYKSIKEKRTLREFEYSQSQVKFDLDFADVLEQGQTKSLSFQVEEEREKHIQGLKMETIRIIWQTIYLLIFLIINIAILFLFDNPTNSHKQYLNWYKNIQNSNATITYSDDTVSLWKFDDILQKDQLLNWMTNKLTNQFLEINMDDSKQILFPDGSADQELQNKSLTGYYIDFYNLLMFNQVRLTLKLAPLKESNQFVNIEPLMIKNLVAYDEDTYFSADGISSSADNILFSTEAKDGLKRKKGYTFGVAPKDFQDLFGRLKRENGLSRQVVTLCIDYALFNPQGPDKGLTYNILIFEFGENGMLKKKEVSSESIVLMKLDDAKSVILLILIIFLAFYMFYNLYQLIQNLRGKYKSYQRWYELYILNYLSPGQLYYRERQKPEIIRKLQYIFNVPIILRFLYTLLICLIVVAFLFLIFKCQYLAHNGQAFNISTKHFFPFNIKQLTENLTFFQYINEFADIMYAFKIVKTISALSVFILCIQILYNLTTNQAFQDILKAIKYVVSQIPHLIFLLWLFISTFGLLTYIKLGAFEKNFSTFLQTYIMMFESFYQLKDILHIFQNDDSQFELFIFLIPYIIFVRFLMLNLFSAVVYKGYETIFLKRQQSKKEDLNEIDPLAIGIQDFFQMSWKLFRETEENKTQKNTEFILQIVKKSQMFDVFDQIKTTVRQYKPQMSAEVWADRCSSDLKKEYDGRSQLKQICDELSLSYMKSLNQGNFSFINELNKDSKRKLSEFQLRLKYYTYFKLGFTSYKQIQWQFTTQLKYFKQKFSTNFNSDSDLQEYHLKSYICKLEEKMKSRQEIVYEIKKDIDLAENAIKQHNNSHGYNPY